MNTSEVYLSNILLDSQIELPSSGIYEPTIIITGGGTGNMVARQIQGRLSVHKDSPVEILSIDTNLSQNQFGQLPPLRERQFLSLDPNAALQALARARAGDPGDAFLLSTVPSADPDGGPYHPRITAKLEDGAGAGQDGRAGKLAFLANISGGRNVKAELEKARQRLVGLREVMQKRAQGMQMASRIRVFIVLSLSGGTGRGMAECLPPLCREIFGADSCSISMIIALPGEHLDRCLSAPTIEKGQTRANAMGGLREIQAFLTEDHGVRPFQFTQNLTVQLGTSAYANSVWLVSEETLGHVPLDSYSDVSYAIGQFLYGLVASGAGTSHQAGLVNYEGAFGDDNGWGRPIYHSFGVSTVEMPVDDLCIYGLRRALETGIANWKSLGVSEQEADEAVSDFLARTPLGDLEILTDQIAPSVPEIEFLGDPTTLAAALRRGDGDFLSEGKTRIEQMGAILAQRSQDFDFRSKGLLSGFSTSLDEEVRELIKKGEPHASRVLRALKDQLAASQKELGIRVAARKGESTALSAHIAKSEKWIRWIPSPLDGRSRRKFVDQVRASLRLKFDAAVSGYLAGCLEEACRLISSQLELVRKFADEARTLEIENLDLIGLLEEKPTPSSLLTYAIPHSEFREWYDRDPIALPPTFNIADLSREALVKGILEPVMASYVAKVRSMKVLEMAEKDETVRRKVLALDTSSKPLFGMIKAAPRIEDLVPQKYLVGDFAGHEDLAGEFESVGDRHPTILESANPYVVSALQTVSNFGIGHWRRYTEAAAAYERDPWRAHVIADYKTLPPLVRRAKDRERALMTLGLGLMTEAISVRGSRYYLNLVEDTNLTPSFSFCGYRKIETSADDDKFPAAAHLVNHRVIQMPAQGRKAEELLGDSLETALDTLGSPKTNGFSGYVENVVEDLESLLGGPSYRKVVRRFLDEVLEKDLSKATKGSSRQIILKETIEILRNELSN